MSGSTAASASCSTAAWPTPSRTPRTPAPIRSPTSTFGSRILNAVSGGNKPPPQAALPTNQSRPHNLAGQLALNFPDNWKSGSTGRQGAGERGRVRHLPLRQRDCPTPAARSTCRKMTTSSPAADRGPAPGGIEGDYNGARLPILQAVRPAPDQGLRGRRAGLHRLLRGPQPLQLQEHQHRLLPDQRRGQHPGAGQGTARQPGRVRERGHGQRRIRRLTASIDLRFAGAGPPAAAATGPTPTEPVGVAQLRLHDPGGAALRRRRRAVHRGPSRSGPPTRCTT